MFHEKNAVALKKGANENTRFLFALKNDLFSLRNIQVKVHELIIPISKMNKAQTAFLPIV